MIYILRYKNLPFFFILVLILLYFPGIVIGLTSEIYNEYLNKFILLFSLSLITFSFFYFIISIIIPSTIRTEGYFNYRIIGYASFLIYFIIFIYIIITSEKIPIIASINGTDSQEIAKLRESFYKARSGFEGILVYLVTTFNAAILPFFIASFFLKADRYRFHFLVLFLITLLLSMEKSLVVRALIPIIILSANGSIKETILKPRYVITFLFLLLLLVTYLSIKSSSSSTQVVLIQQIIEQNPELLKYYITSNPDNPLLFMVNRIFWIPTVTALDWLEYFDRILDSRYVYGASSSLFSTIFSVPRINLERLVFEYEFGQNEFGTGSANTAYFVDIYLNFGYVGVVLSNFILAIICRFFLVFKNKASIAAFFVFTYIIATGSLIAVIFSSGLLVLMILNVLIKK